MAEIKPGPATFTRLLQQAAASMNGLRLRCNNARRIQNMLYVARKEQGVEEFKDLVFYVPPGQTSEVWIINPRGLEEAASEPGSGLDEADGQDFSD